MRLGDTVGQYRILDVVGQGGMAAVYVGVHSVVEHRVAIKVVHPRHLDNPRMTQRFLNEARAVAAIRHPGIVEFYDFGRADDGRAYIVMELLSGETLQARLVNGPIEVPQALAFGRQMASALRAAHQRGIVHRDLKPANVFLVADPDVPFGERAKILDFGIAKHTTDERPEEITGTGMLIGTPAHMSPEQCRGDKDIDGRADVYALGVLLYHMMTGRLPFDGEGTGEIVSRHLYEECPRASKANRDVPVAVSDVIARCMAKDRAKRYQNMEDVAAALGAAADSLESVVRLPRRAPVVKLATGSRPPQPPPPAMYKHTLAHLPNVSNTPTQPWVGDKTNAPTLTRTIVDAPSWVSRLRDRTPEMLLTAAASAVVIAAVVVAMMAMRGVAEETPPPPPPEMSAEAAPVAPARAPTKRTSPRADRAERSKQRAHTPPAPRAREKEKEKEKDKDKDEKPRRGRAKPAAPAARPAAPKPTPAPEDPFATVATPALY